MKTNDAAIPPKADWSPARPPQKAPGATGGGLAGGGDANAKMVPDPEVVAKKTRRKLTAQGSVKLIV